MSDKRIGFAALIAFAAWLFIALPLIYLPEHNKFFHEPFGLKPAELLLAAATLGLWYATHRLVKGSDKTAERQLRA